MSVNRSEKAKIVEHHRDLSWCIWRVLAVFSFSEWSEARNNFNDVGTLWHVILITTLSSHSISR